MNQAKPKIRLYVPEAFHSGNSLPLNENQSHYLSQVMRVSEGDSLAVFNGSDGEWLAQVGSVRKRSVTINLQKQLKPQRSGPDIWLAFAPIKNKTDIVVEKAVELGASKLLVVYTRHAVVTSINAEKLNARAAEAAEQCERLDVPLIEERRDLGALLGSWPNDRTLLWADESGTGQPLDALLASLPRGKYAVLTGPEGGFSTDEQKMLKAASVRAFGMGPRILRADTAVIAALACVQAKFGDWNEKPSFEGAA